MGWCHYQGRDGNCDHTNVIGSKCCPGIEKNHLFALEKGHIADEERAMREQLLDDLGITSQGTASTKKLREDLLETKIVERKKNINKGKKGIAAVYETYAATVFKHDIKWCRCHMLPSDILPGQRPGSLTWNEGFRLYSQQYIKNHSDSIRPAPKQNRASLTPLAKNLLDETSTMLDRIGDLIAQVSQLKLDVQAKEKEIKTLEANKSQEIQQLEWQHSEEIKSIEEEHARILESMTAVAQNNYAHAHLWKATAEQLQERELNICETQNDMRMALKTIENVYMRSNTPIPWDHTLP